MDSFLFCQYIYVSSKYGLIYFFVGMIHYSQNLTPFLLISLGLESVNLIFELKICNGTTPI